MLLGRSTMNISYKINNELSNKCTRTIRNSKLARTSPYDGTESRDTTSLLRYLTRTSKLPTNSAQSQKFASV